MTLQTIDVQSVSAFDASFIEERLGPKPQWDGYSAISDQEVAQRVYGKVGFIHAQSAEVGRGVVAIGQTLREIKEDLPHGQFMDCVKAEFGWTRQWAQQLMQVAERFSNVKSTCHLPSSAQVLALLAQSGADDETVQQAADEHWTVSQTKAKLGGEKQRQRTRVQELKAALKLPAEIRQLVAAAESISQRQLMDELNLDDLPTGTEHRTATHLYLKNKDGWHRIPDQQPVDVPVTPAPPQPQQPDGELVSVAVAAERMGKDPKGLSVALCHAKSGKRKPPKGNGWQAEPHPTRGMCLIRRVA